jgi:branched-chain amino acid transport system substrate-binding protein
MSPGARFQIAVCGLVSVLVIASGCSSSGGGSGSPSSTTAPVIGATSAGGQQQTSTPSPGGWDIDAALAADADCPTPLTGEPLRISYAADLGGLGSFADAPAAQAADYLAKLINCSGGLAGRPVAVSMADIAGDPLNTRNAIKGLLGGGANVLLGPPFPDLGFRVLEVTDGKVPVIFVASTEPALGDDSHLSFLVSFNDTQGATAAAQFAKSQSWEKAVTFSSPGPYFGYLTKVFAGALTSLGGTVLKDYPFVVADQIDFKAEVADMAANPPDVIYSGMLANQLVALKADLAQAGLGQVQLLSTDSFEITGGYSLSPGNEGIYHVTHTNPEPGTRLERMLGGLTTANGGVPTTAPSMAALAGDALAVIADAYLRTGSTDPQVLGQAIANARNVQGITGVLTYNHSGAPNKPMYIQRVVNGKATLAGVIGG